MKNRKLKRKLDIVWRNGDGSRYVAKASPARPPGSHAWDVFDRATDKFLSPKAVMLLSDADLASKLAN